MNDRSGETAALAPLWSLTLGAAAGASATIAISWETPLWISVTVGAVSLMCALFAARSTGKFGFILWFVAGLGLAGGHGLVQSGDRGRLEALIGADDAPWVRTRLAVTEGWSRGRWGWRSRVEVLEADHPTRIVPHPRRCRLEIRGAVPPLDLPPPGTVIRALVSIRGEPGSPLLVTSSIRLVEPEASRRFLPATRSRLADSLLAAADLDVDRIRAAELAAALSLGRRDLIPPLRRDGWRRSGMAHLLAVSGLHVGLVAGMVWLGLTFGGASPTAARWTVLIVLPTYALLAGASPSAVRAALMGSIYLSARLLGRALVPMAAVLLTATLLLIADPSLIAQPAFQLTVILTAALVRWTPSLVDLLPLPRWLAAAIAVPIIAQLAAAPMVACHFASVIPGTSAANLLVPWLLGPLVLGSVAATLTAIISPTAAGWLLDLVHFGSEGLWTVAAPARWMELVPPPIPWPILALLVLSGMTALLPSWRAKAGLAVYAAALCASAGWWWVVPAPASTAVELLPVTHGQAVRLTSAGGHLLVDGGARLREASAALAASRVRQLSTVLVSHGDEDHIGGIETVLRTMRVDALVIPAWMQTSAETVPLLRAARRRGTRVVPVVRGSRLAVSAAVIEVLWPPAIGAPPIENERSIVARLVTAEGTVLITADIGTMTEEVLVASTNLEADLLIVPHHGSRSSSSADFLRAVGAPIGLIPAGPGNLHNHPHAEVLQRLEDLGIDFRAPILDGPCGARIVDGAWVLYP